MAVNPQTNGPPAVILAGGRSMRMGRDKADVTLGGVPLIRRIAARLAPQAGLVAVNRNSGSSPPGVAVFEDTLPGQAGPMAGVLSAMRHVAMRLPGESHVATVPTDTPFLPLDLLARLQSAVSRQDQIAVAFSVGIMHPVFALWPVGLADDLQDWLATDAKRRVRAFIGKHPMVAVDFSLLQTAGGPVDPFFNINTPADLETAEGWLPLVEEMER
ncbi:molybdenum cofactor guanylyltransferase MobA [Pararhizobium gei]|uniref:molybdenum cofactor guanylyltransferase MobA n=1 Tax=Pararhizobium gei TaxID=1395951 RepID=UPI0023DA143E|nr:molybdenum cofactor guanylyltransferase MobA [Rhizobium gei]